MTETTEQRLERVARALCEARGQEPDAMVLYDNGTMALSRRPAWQIAAAELRAMKLLLEHVEMLADDAAPADGGRHA